MPPRRLRLSLSLTVGALLTACEGTPMFEPVPVNPFVPPAHGPQIAVRVHGHPRVFADARTWRQAITTRLASQGLVASPTHCDLAQHHDRLASLGLLPARAGDDMPAAELLLECQLVDQKQDTRPIKGFVLGPIRSNDHLVTARVALAIRLLHVRSQRQIVATEVDGLGQRTETITELNVGNYDAQIVASDGALQEAVQRALDQLAARVDAALASR